MSVLRKEDKGGGVDGEIKNKNELKRRIDLFLDELDYSINEKFCKETMKMMKEFIGHASHRLDCEDSRVKSLKKKLKEYKDLEEQGLLLRLPCKIGSTLYQPVYSRINEYKVIGLCFDIHHNKWMYEVAYETGFEWHKTVCDFNYIGKTVFLTKAEAEQKLKEMESD